MALAKRNEGANINSNINVTPMVDVMLVLLIIFRVLSRLLHLFFFQAEDGIRDLTVTGVQTCALPIFSGPGAAHSAASRARQRTHPSGGTGGSPARCRREGKGGRSRRQSQCRCDRSM